MNGSLLLLLAVAIVGPAVLSWMLVGAVRRFAPRLGLVDQPNARSLHTRPTPRGGGLGIVLPVLAVAAASLFGRGADAGRLTVPGANPLLGYVVGAGLVALVSLWDDIRSLAPGWKLAVHLVAAGAVVWGAGGFAVVQAPFAGPLALPVPAGAALAVLWVVGLTNLYNFMDGSDGLAATQGLVAAAAWLVVATVGAGPHAILLSLLLLAGCIGFLPHNWSPAKIFMGDVGSAFLGFSFAALPLLGPAEEGVRLVAMVRQEWRLPVFAVLVLWPFLGDGLLTLARRTRRREPVWKAHRTHLYQRLVQSGWSHARVAVLYAAWAAASAAVACWWFVGGRGADLLAVVFPAVTLVALFLFVGARERRVPPAA